MTLAKIELLKQLLRDNEAKTVLKQTTVDQYNIIRKFNTSRIEKNPSLRMKWAMCSNFPLALTKGDMANRIPLEYKGIQLKTNAEDIGTKGQMCSIAAVTWWNTYGPIGDTEGFERVYESFFLRKMRLDNATWGRITFGPVERVRKRVLLNPLTKEMPPDEASNVIMEILFPKEAGIPRESTWIHRELIKEKREKLKGTMITPIVLAYMLERELVARRRFLPVAGATSAEFIEMLHCLQGENWRQIYHPGGNKLTESRSQSMIVACRKIIRRSIVASNPLELAVEIANKTVIDTEPLKSCLAAIDGGDVACDIIRAALGLKIRQRQRFGRLELKRISGRGFKNDEEILIGNGTIQKIGIWDGEEEFHVRCGECRGILKKSKMKLEKLLINSAKKEDMRDLIILCMVFSQDTRMFQGVRGEINFLNRAGQLLSPMYQLQRYFLNRSNDLFDQWGYEESPKASELHGINESMNASDYTLKGIVVTRNVIDDFSSTETEKVSITKNLSLIKRTGEVIMGANDVSELESQAQLMITYDTPKMWEMGTTKELVQNTYQWVLKNLVTLKAQFLLGKEDMFQWDAFEAFESIIPQKMAGQYSGFARAVLKQMRDQEVMKTDQFIKLLPFCFSPPKLRSNGEPYQFLKLVLKGGGENFIEVRKGSPLFSYNPQTEVLTICGRMMSLKGKIEDEERNRSMGNAVLAGFLVSGKYDPDLGDFKTVEELEKLKPGEKANILLYQGKPVKVVKRKRYSALSNDISQGIKRQRMTVESMGWALS
ncbi:polymerase PB2 [Influenza B virus]|uniref:Polymerase basic protein 2 n=1 Tax=Influenza B virus TaxID=11520 RepID=A0A6H1XCT7_9INFB|nr:polymerase PB2 [Influenza B virus]